MHETIDDRLIKSKPARHIGDKAFDSDKLDAEPAEKGLEMIASNHANIKKT